jgi:hypothetical protein
MEDSSEKEEKEKTLLLHYDKHENNFPPIFSIKIIAFFISFCLIFAGEVCCCCFFLLLACLKLKSLLPSKPSSKEPRVDEMEMKTFIKTLEISAF